MRNGRQFTKGKGPLALTATDIEDPLTFNVGRDAHSAATLKPSGRCKRSVIGQDSRIRFSRPFVHSIFRHSLEYQEDSNNNESEKLIDR